jgi:hypothetical protein
MSMEIVDNDWVVDFDNLIDYFYFNIFFNRDDYYFIEPYL